MPRIDKNKCIGCGVCANICPDGFEIVNNKSHIKNPNASCVKEAASSCPTNAIILEEEDSSGSNQNKDTEEEQSIPSRGRGRGMGMGLGRGMGRGLGLGRGRRGMGRGRRMGKNPF